MVTQRPPGNGQAMVRLRKLYLCRPGQDALVQLRRFHSPVIAVCIQPDAGYDVTVFHRQAQPDVSGRELTGDLGLLWIYVQLPVVTGIHQCADGKGQLLQGYTFRTYWQIPAYCGTCIYIVKEIGYPLTCHNAAQDV